MTAKGGEFLGNVEVDNRDQAWIGVDLDGVLAHYDGWKGIKHIGEPIPETIKRVKRLLEDGMKVKVFTARACEGEEAIKHIKKWLIEAAGLPELEVTNAKDFNMVSLWDDRCVQFVKNAGVPLAELKAGDWYSPFVGKAT